MLLSRSPALALLALAACKPPPPAPEGLDEASRYLVREFYADDATFQAGVQGFMQWFEDEGKGLVGLGASLDGEAENTKPVDAFTVGDLLASDVVALPLEQDLLTGEGANNGTGETTPRDVATAAGVVSVAEMDCTWKEAEALLVRTDQNSVFAGDWEGYERTYNSERATFEGATADEVFTAIDERIDPFAEGFDHQAYGATLLMTDNIADPTALLGVNIPGYPLDLDLRHARVELLDGSTVGVLSILTYNVQAVWGPTGDNGLRQSFSIEINVEREGDKTLRMLAVWAEPVSPLIGADAAATLTYAVNKSQKSSERMSAVCAGEVEVPAEP
jgi:hypothetical protein